MARRQHLLAALLAGAALSAAACSSPGTPSGEQDLRAALESMRTRPRMPAPTPRVPAADPSPDPARLAAAQARAQSVIDSGRLNGADVRALTAMLEDLPRRDAFEIRRRIAHAVNTGRLVPAEAYFTLP